MRTKNLIEALHKKFKTKNTNQLAPFLGITLPALLRWNTTRSLPPLQIANTLHKARKAATKQAHTHTIKPIAEFFPIEATKSRGGANFELVGTADGHPLYNGLRNELENSNGIYIFYDSRGHALYAGKAKKQSLWKEMNLAFNRERETQKIMLVDHPERKQAFKAAHAQERKIAKQYVFLHELAHYFSAYAVDDGMINVLEAFLVRGFANNLLNKNMERFKH